MKGRINGNWWKNEIMVKMLEKLKKWSNKNVIKYSMEIFCVKSFNKKIQKFYRNLLKFCVFFSSEKGFKIDGKVYLK